MVLDVDDVRVRLERLGYLRVPMERFVAGRGPIGSGLAVAGMALRAALVAAPPLAVLTTFGLAASDPWLLAWPVDLLVLFGWFSLLYGIAVALAGAALGLFLSVWVQREGASLERLPRWIGWMSGAAVLLYLLAWWRANGTSPTPPLLLVSGALAGLGVCGSLSRLAALFAYIVIQPAVFGERGHNPQARLRSWTPYALFVVGSVAWVVFLSLGNGGQPAAPIRIEAHQGRPVILIAVDGAYGPAVGTPWLELFAPLVQHADLLWHIDLGGNDRMATHPAFWTEVATGVQTGHGVETYSQALPLGVRVGPRLDPSDLGFYELLQVLLPGLRLTRDTPTDSTRRTVRTIWEVADMAGMTSAVINWWASYPVEPLTGVQCSERAFFVLRENGTLTESDLYPKGVHTEARSILAKVIADATETLPGAIVVDRFHLRLAREVWRNHSPDLLCLYLNGVDVLRHEQHPAFLSHAQWVVQHVRAFLQTAERAPVVCVVLGPGFGLRQVDTMQSIALWHHLGESGANEAVVPATAFAPAVLSLLGLPRSQEYDLEGLRLVLDSRFGVERTVPTYGRRVWGLVTVGDVELQRRHLERLKREGYLSAPANRISRE